MTMTELTKKAARERWMAWQKAHEIEAAAIRNEFATRAITLGFRHAQNWLAQQISNKLCG